MIARLIRVSGKVQGVWFRDWTILEANARGLSGWVRNRLDGSVEVLAMGQPESVEKLIERLHEGSPASQVAKVDVRATEVEPLDGFGRRPTV
ncbi:MAG: acylphosphatase [Novosphingobium sp.]